ncbi:MAG: M20/M25/M40 family metallo-hydrolase [Thermotogaceae bacterium]|nr:M20/M25/M40 family metallo-hydrolase [Thermotogaceae bacterium]
MIETIKTLTEISGPSGRETKVRNTLIEMIKDHVDGYEVDKVGNLIAWKGDGGNPVVLVAHMDEIGIVVTNEIKEGFYRIEPVGGVSPYTALNRRYVLQDGTVGVVGVERETAQDVKKNLTNLSFDTLYLDTFGKKVDVGTFGVFDSHFYQNGDFLVSKAMDDRIGCAILVEIVRGLKNPKRRFYIAFSIQEEVGLVGSSVLAYPLDAQEAIAIDVTDSADSPKSFKRHPMVIGKGPAIKIKDRYSISDKRIVDKLVKVAKDRGIPYQLEVLTFGGTDAAALMRTREGIPSATVSVPTRYIHTPNEVVGKSDVENTIKLLIEYIQAV